MMASTSVREVVAQYENDVGRELKRFHSRTHWEATEDRTPVDEAMAHELSPSDRMVMEEPEHYAAMTPVQLAERLELRGIVLSQAIPVADMIAILREIDCAEQEAKREERRNSIALIFNYFVADGVHPAAVLRRLYAVGNYWRIPPFCLLTVRERGFMLGDSHGAQHWRMQRICVDPDRRQTGRVLRAPGQKSLQSRARFAEAQRGNSNRKRKRRRALKKGKKK